MNNNSKKISIAMTTYNGEKFLKKQLDSLLAQTLMPFEIIICDDCSKDNTRNILENYKTNHNNLIKIYLNETNLGYIKNFEKALSLCSGDFIALCDQDDIWEPYRLKKIMPLLCDKTLVYTDSLLIDNNDKIIPKELVKDCSSFQKNKFMSVFLRKGTVQGASMILSKKLFELSLPFPKTIPHDVWLMLIAKDTGNVVLCSETKLLYRIHNANVIGINSSKKDIISFLRELKYLIKRRNSTYYLLYQRSNELLRLNFIKDKTRKDLVCFNNLCKMILFPKSTIQFKPFFINLRYFSNFINLDNDYFIIPYLKILSLFYTPKRF